METRRLSVAKRPCGSCPYRKDVPSGVWEQHEYDKLPAYDGMTGLQDPHIFMCHQRDGNVCAGWLACHGTQGPNALLAMRFAALRRSVDPALFDYTTDVEVFASGAEARAHGMSGIEQPPAEAERMIGKLMRRRSR